MATECICNAQPVNTGTSPCNPVERPIDRVIIMPLYDSAGNKNGIDLTSNLDTTYFDGLINEADITKRIFPVARMENVEPTKADSITETFNSGRNIFLNEGIKTIVGLLVPQNRQYLGKLKNYRSCQKFGVFEVDKDGNVRGIHDVANSLLLPIAVDEQTWDPKWMDAQDTLSQKIQLTYSYDQSQRDEEISVLIKSEMNNYDWINANGLLDVNATFTSPTITGITVKLELDFGSVLGKIPVEGRVVADWGDALNPGKFYNVTTASWETIVTAVESATVPGEYALTFAAQTTLDVSRFPMTMTGYDTSSFATADNILI